jgi:hypothetical protein
MIKRFFTGSVKISGRFTFSKQEAKQEAKQSFAIFTYNCV